MKWNPKNTPLSIMSIFLIGLGFFLFFWPLQSSLPLPSIILLMQSLVSVILIGAGIILPIVKWRR